MTNLAEERTLILVKPDGVSSHHVGEIITRIERKGYEIEALKVVSATEDQLKQHYNDKVDKPYFPDMLSYMQSGPIVGIVAAGTNITKAMHRMAGNTNPGEAEFGTIRGDYSMSFQENIVHASDSPETAEVELKRFFKPEEIFEIGRAHV